jgi:hypothetical protein
MAGKSERDRKKNAADGLASVVVCTIRQLFHVSDLKLRIALVKTGPLFAFGFN